MGGIKDALATIISPKGKIVEDPLTNSIIITDMPSKFKALEKVLKKLDVFVPQVMIEAEGGDLRVVFDKCISPTSIAVVEGPNSEHGAGGVALLTPLVPSPGPIRSWSIGRPPLNYREEVLATALQKGDRVGVTVGWAGVQPTVESLGADVELAKGKRDGVVHGPLADGGTAVSGSVDGSVSVRC